MNDKELLELAAQAANIEVVWRNNSGAFYYDNPDTGREEFDPLTDDGEALRLAVKLGLFIDAYSAMTTVGRVVDPLSLAVKTLEEAHCSEPYAATRRAIVRAAAEIGRNMK